MREKRFRSGTRGIINPTAPMAEKHASLKYRVATSTQSARTVNASVSKCGWLTKHDPSQYGWGQTRWFFLDYEEKVLCYSHTQDGPTSGKIQLQSVVGGLGDSKVDSLNKFVSEGRGREGAAAAPEPPHPPFRPPFQFTASDPAQPHL